MLAVIVEPQGRDDPTKKYSWPAYVTNLRKANQCPEAILIVVCWDEAEAEKCRVAINTGHPVNARGIGLTAEQRERVTSCSDLGQLDQWYGRALSATTAADVFED